MIGLLLRIAAGEPARLLSEAPDALVLALGDETHPLPRLPDAALRAQLETCAVDDGMLVCSGWAARSADGIPPAVIALAGGDGWLHLATRRVRPDIRAVHRLDYDMTGFAAQCPEAAPPGTARLLFLEPGGTIAKRVTP